MKGKRVKESRSRTKKILRLLLLAAGALLLLSVSTVTSLRWIPPPVSSLMVQRWVAARWQGEDYRLRYDWVGLKKISPNAAIAVVASEDQLFPAHFGFDFDAISRAVTENRRRAQPRGASTITQQVAKNLFLWPGRSWLRKGMEVYCTVLLECLWPKRRILEVYLNVAELGDGVFGVGAASGIYFGKPAARLTQHEAALLAAVLPNPREYSAMKPSPYIRERALQIQQQMRQLGGAGYLRTIMDDNRRR